MKIVHVKTKTHNPNVIISIPPMKKYFCGKYKLSFTNRIKRQRRGDIERNLNQINCSSYEIHDTSNLTAFSEISEPNFGNIENPVNVMESNQADSITSNHTLEDNKPGNWKLQKLEKKFLKKYLEASLQKYDKHTCIHNWMPSTQI